MLNPTHIKPPQAKRELHETKIHGVSLQDDYFWLKNRGDKEVLDYLNAENAYTDSVMEKTKGLQEKLYQEMLSRIKETDLSVPVKRGGYYYYSRTEKGKSYPIYCRKKESLEAPEEIMLDMNALAEGHEYFDVGALTVSSDGHLLAYSTDISGAEVYILRVKDLRTGQLLADEIPNTATSVVWAEDNKTLFYSVLDEARRPYKLFKHKLGSSAESDTEVFHEADDRFFLNFSKTKDKTYLILDLSSKVTSEVYYLDALNPDDEFQVIHPREQDLEYSVEHQEGKFLIITNENALNFKLSEVSVENPSKENWKDVIPHRPEVKLEDVEVFQDYRVVFERIDGLEQIRIFDLISGKESYVKFDEATYTLSLGNNPEYDSKILRFGYSSLVTPGSVYDYDLETGERELKKQHEVLGGYDPDQYVTERMMVPSHDGTEVPISLVYKKGLKKNGKNPFYLYGYGSYGINIEPSFGSNRLSLLDRGVIFAIAHIRGGGEMGRPWEDNGKLLCKKNTFEDFIACAEYVVKEKYTSPEKLITSGGSAGGLLMGAVLNARPDLFHAAVLDVPFVDVMNTMLDETLPLTVTEYEEWGNPNEKESFDYMLSYSPYDNIEAKDYPAMLVTGGLNDPRVQYWEPAKWIAKLRATKTDQNILLLKMNMSAGHGGPSGRYDYLKEVAFHYVFLLFSLSIEC